jgi:hypothetical protein
MGLEPVEVSARWEDSQGFLVSQFIWQGRPYPIESTGRRWEDEEGLHILCMAFGGQVFELVFRLQPASWFLRPPSATHRLA